MTDAESGLSAAALDDVAYLSRSENRVAILEALATAGATRGELADRTGTSRTTLDRIVNELEDRGWARRTSAGTYTTTPAGSHLLAQFRPFLESVAAIHTLGETVSWLPTEELTIGLEHFADATVKRPANADPADTIDLMADMFRNAEAVRALTHLIPPIPVERALYEGGTAGTLDAEGVMTADSLEFIRADDERRARWTESLLAGSRLYRYDGSVPCNCWIVDDTVLIKKSGPGAIPESYGVPIISENETVLRWAHDLVDRYRDEATPVDVDTWAEPAPSTE